MIIEKIEITKFRGFENVEFSLGSQITVIAGKNGTQKTTILGLLSQPFSISMLDNPMRGEKPLCGGNFKSDFKEKFKLSEKFDLAKQHEWTLHLKNSDKPFKLESIKTGDRIRFWRKGDKSKGSGYVQLPVIFLSLKRLIPIGEDNSLKESSTTQLTKEEETFFTTWHKKILISMDEVISSNYLESPDKNTVGINTENYDWSQNSTGQDNVGKILLAIMSFKRLKENHKSYKGGILAIDELDATLYPGSQIKLVEAFSTFSSKYNIQIIFTTHSLTILEYCCQKNINNQKIAEKAIQMRVVYLEKKNNKVKLDENVTIGSIKNRLMASYNQIATKPFRIPVYTEDHENIIFTKALLKSKASKLNFVQCPLGYSKFINLAESKIPSFLFPNGIVILDGDVRANPTEYNKVKKLTTFLLLPMNISPERILANFLYHLDDDSPVWSSIDTDFNKESCFNEYPIDEILKFSDKAKSWFKLHLKSWGTNAIKVINPWIKENEEEAKKFVSDFINVYNRFAKELALDKIEL